MSRVPSTRPGITILVAASLSLVGHLAAEVPAPNQTLQKSVKPSSEVFFSAQPTTDEIRKARVFAETLEPIGQTAPAANENRALASALTMIRASRRPGKDLNVAPAEEFLKQYPTSPWRVALWTNLGIEYYQRGSFSKCLAAWRLAWSVGKAESNPSAARLVDASVGELARMLARIGRMEELESLLAAVGNRQLLGSPAEALAGAREGLWEMRHHPETSFKCGPYALESILSSQDPTHPFHALLSAAASTAQGMSLAQVARLAGEAQLAAKMVKRGDAITIPVPSVVHWKLGHYGALLKTENGRYLLQDPTFGTSQWISQSVIDEESSGYFLLVVNDGKIPAGWREASDGEAGAVWGKGRPNGSNSNGSGPKDKKKPKPPRKPPKKDPCDKKGMATWSVHLMLVSLSIEDFPLGYVPPVGPEIEFRVNYDLREANQPATLSFSNFGRRWNFNWITTLTFDTNNAYVRSGEGGTLVFPSFTSSSTISATEITTQSYIVRDSPTVYRLVYPDGSMSLFEVSDGSGRFYLTKLKNPAGNAVTLTYDGQFRLTRITDAIGQQSTLTYGLAGDPLKITKITDPFGRTAQFNYNAGNQLIQITDAAGLTSQFAYGSGDDIQSLTTGYGVTTFAGTDGGDNLTRSLTVTNPDGSQEMFKSFSPPDNAPEIPVSEPLASVPQGMPVVNNYLQYRNIFYWDRKAMQEAPGDYASAHIFHFLHEDLSLAMGRVLESEKAPLENRIWYTYQGQTLPGFITSPGMLEKPTAIGRVLDDGTTQLTQYTYNALGNPTTVTDPLGRKTYYLYDANQIDVLTVIHAGGASFDFIASYSYNSQHLPLTLTDAAGQTTVFTYNAAGQILTLTNAKQEPTTFTYDGNGYLNSVEGFAAGATGRTDYTYDSAGRVKTTTNALGYTLTFAYDNLDRVTSITYPDATQEKFSYTLLDVTKLTDRLGRETNYTFDPLGNLTSATDPLNQTAKFSYCRCGAITSLTDPLGQQTQWEYDLQGRLTGKIFPDGTKTTTIYEKTTSRTKYITDARGQTTAFDYNADDTLRLVAYSGTPVTTPTVSFTYDPNYVRVTSRVDGTGTTTYSYFPISFPTQLGAGGLASVISPLSSISYGYDELGRVISRTVDGATETVTFDGLDRTENRSNQLGAFNHTYLGNSRLETGMSLPNGQSVARTYFGANGDYRLQEILNRRPNAATLSRWDYTYDPVGNITSWSGQRDSTAPRVATPGHDLADQLTTVAFTNPTATFGYAYDAAGNRRQETINGTTTTSAFNSLNEIASTQPPADPDRTYEWDATGRLTAINYAGNSNRTELSYDGLGRRSKTVEKNGANVTSVRQHVWDRLELLEERDGAGSLTKRFFPQGVAIMEGPNAGSYFYATDHLGNIRELTDTSGAVRARYDYDPFGRRTKTSGDLDADLGFTGHYYHAPSGLTLAPFRAYDANLGRWISRDPSGETESPNLYTYVDNNPLNFLDPSGRDKLGGVGGVAKNLTAPALQLGIITLRNKIAEIEQTRANLYEYLKKLQRGQGKICPKERAEEIARLKARLDELESYANNDRAVIAAFEKALEILAYLP